MVLVINNKVLILLLTAQTYSGDTNTRPVWYLSSERVSGCPMVQNSNVVPIPEVLEAEKVWILNGIIKLGVASKPPLIYQFYV